MGKTIRLEASVYGRLEQFRDKRETYSDAVGRLLTIRDGLASLTRTIEGVTEYAEFQRRKLAAT